MTIYDDIKLQNATPIGAHRILKRRDLPQTKIPTKYRVTVGGKTTTHVFKKRVRQMLEALQMGPVYCASPVRLSPAVQTLRECPGEDAIATDWHENGKDDEYCRFGTYRLVAIVEPLEVSND